MKSDSNGIGFKAGAGLVESLGRSALRPRAQSFLVSNVSLVQSEDRLTYVPVRPYESRFGLGALNEAEDDDIDVYDSDDPCGPDLYALRCHSVTPMTAPV
jgi:hypothetical protein